ncbi:hypothetical protein ACFQVC_01125 [Streptomyces monticola]|uniref:Yip1 domain-containing protein n=1 Tax=Streptomyces monticola TaxID=2666263 RepID=A0ABW2JAH6_9ACTN
MNRRTESPPSDAPPPTLIAPAPPSPRPAEREAAPGPGRLGRGIRATLDAGQRLRALRRRPMAGAVLLAGCGQLALMLLLTRELPLVTSSSPDPRLVALWLVLLTVLLIVGHLVLGVTTVVLARALGGRGGLHRTPGILGVLGPLASAPVLLGGFLVTPDSTVAHTLRWGFLALLAVQLTRHVLRTQEIPWGRAFLACSLALTAEYVLVQSTVTQTAAS